MLIFDLIIGLGIFLFGMMQLEHGIESLNASWIKRWLRNNTDHPIKSVLTGTVITAIVQSSSMVSLIMLAFASASLIPLMNAIGVLLGANLGTTFTGWVVATLGFKLDLDAIALPVIGLGALMQVFADKQQQLRSIGVLMLGLGMLIFGLSMMKQSVAVLPEQFDLQLLQHFNAVSFLVLGTLLTAVIQSSSATMMIALTALSSGIITLPDAAALVIGADLGTTSTTILGSLKGSPVKRQLAFAHFSFNLVTNLLAFAILLPLLPVLMNWLTLTDPLYSLVAFHSCFNIFGLFIFVPLLKPFSDWISKRFVDDTNEINLDDVPVSVPEAAINVSQEHVHNILIKAFAINTRNLRIEQKLHIDTSGHQLLINALQTGLSFEQHYEKLKQQEGQFLRYVTKLQTQSLDKVQSEQLVRLIDATRDAVFSVKTLKDIRPNLIELRHASAPSLKQFYKDYQAQLISFHQQLFSLFVNKHEPVYVREQFDVLAQQNELMHEQFHRDIQTYCCQDQIEPQQLSTLFNVNREVWQSGKNILDALKHWYGISLL